MENLILEYLAWQVLIWTSLTFTIWIFAKLGEIEARNKKDDNKQQNRV